MKWIPFALALLLFPAIAGAQLTIPSEDSQTELAQTTPTTPASTGDSLVAGSAFTTNAIPCFLASRVLFRVSSTTAKQCSLAVIEVSDDSTNWVASYASQHGVTASNDAASFSLAGVLGVALGGSPLVGEVMPIIKDSGGTSKPDSGGLIKWRWVRAKFTAGYAGNFNSLARFTVTSMVLRPSDWADRWNLGY